MERKPVSRPEFDWMDGCSCRSIVRGTFSSRKQVEEYLFRDGVKDYSWVFDKENRELVKDCATVPHGHGDVWSLIQDGKEVGLASAMQSRNLYESPMVIPEIYLDPFKVSKLEEFTSEVLDFDLSPCKLIAHFSYRSFAEFQRVRIYADSSQYSSQPKVSPDKVSFIQKTWTDKYGKYLYNFSRQDSRMQHRWYIYVAQGLSLGLKTATAYDMVQTIAKSIFNTETTDSSIYMANSNFNFGLMNSCRVWYQLYSQLKGKKNWATRSNFFQKNGVKIYYTVAPFLAHSVTHGGWPVGMYFLSRKPLKWKKIYQKGAR